MQQKGELQLENAGLEERVQALQEEMGVMHDEKEALLDRCPPCNRHVTAM